MGKLTMSLDKPINDLKSQYKKSHIIICQTPTSTASVDGSNQMKADGTLPRKKGYIYIYTVNHTTSPDRHVTHQEILLIIHSSSFASHQLTIFSTRVLGYHKRSRYSPYKQPSLVKFANKKTDIHTPSHAYVTTRKKRRVKQYAKG
ncbi:hypothetical protein HBI38_136100 [Parastagonospora nodorum]|nr:hypothetical protein HBH76_087900 [Parastagonospora nodorum]KAH5193913.1 hypothetical protein HBH68_140370 [Parastagonospora nodorum]KAH5370798.1 hypothetical protein HBI49_069730 [Parastagonospora nodorum]KAH5431060.1 hypothetical protein HBI47_109450 [Parastagonospora nodorum]KAH5451106.1 hypothetical protein HBI30_134930 [Parastagonospora nodorum]